LGALCGAYDVLRDIGTIFQELESTTPIFSGRVVPKTPNSLCILISSARTAGQVLWFSWGVFFDPGTQTGLAPLDPIETKTVAVLMSIAGFIFNLTIRPGPPSAFKHPWRSPQ
jgi:hypothetical protein